jgi:hypothetical protein
VLLVVLLQEEVVRLGVVVVCRGLGDVVAAAVIGTAERCLWRGRGVAERQRRADQLLIPEIASQLRLFVT